MSRSDEAAAPDRQQPAYKFAEDVVQRRVAAEMVLLHTRRQHYFGLGEVGADIVTRLVTLPLNEAMAGLAHDYQVDMDVLIHDVEALVEDLLAAGLLDASDHGR